jgi:hypothetical protein
MTPTTIGVLVVAAIIIPVVILIVEIDWLENTLGVNSLIAWSVLPGVLAAILFARALQPTVDLFAFDAWVVRGIIAIPCVALSIALASLSSRMVPRDSVEHDFAVLGKEHYEAGYRSRAEWLITVEHAGRAESIRVAQTVYDTVAIGARYNTQVIVGLWGHEIIPPPGRTCSRCTLSRVSVLADASVNHD